MSDQIGYLDNNLKLKLREGWAKFMVDNELAIPKGWYEDFIKEVTSSDDNYRKALEDSLRKFGVRWA